MACTNDGRRWQVEGRQRRLLAKGELASDKANGVQERQTGGGRGALGGLWADRQPRIGSESTDSARSAGSARCHGRFALSEWSTPRQGQRSGLQVLAVVFLLSGQWGGGAGG